MIRLAVAGAAGRMGSRIIALAQSDPRVEVVAALEAAGHSREGHDVAAIVGAPVSPPLTIQNCTDTTFDVLIDFTVPAGTAHWLERCTAAGRAIVIGTTGHTPQQEAAIAAAAARIPVLHASNMSPGVNLLFALVERVAAALREGYDIEIVETHHREKRDAPSGTAKSLRDVILRASGRSEADVVYGRSGEPGKRPANQVGIHALRLGSVVGEHEVHFGSLEETLVLKHTAHTRDIFARGALTAAIWLHGKPAGKYDMRDVLNL